MRRLVLALVLVLLLAPRLAAQSVMFGTSTSLPSTCQVGSMTYLTTSTVGLYYCSAQDTWTLLIAPYGGVPAGAIVFVSSGTCPSGYTEVAGLNGKMVRGTVAANSDVGGTGGSDSVTPTFTGSALATHTHTLTATGTNGTVSFTPVGTIAWPAGVPTNAAITAGTPTGTVSALTTGADSSTTGGVAKAIAQTPTFTGSALGTHTHTISWPAGVPTLTGTSGTVPAETFTGSSATSSAVTGGTPAGTISAVDTRAAYIKLIGCSKN